MKSKNSGVEKKNENPFLVNDLEAVWEEWKKKGKLISREDLEIKIKRAARLQKMKKAGVTHQTS